MRLFGLQIKKTPKGASPRSGILLSDEDREASLQIRRVKAEVKKLQAERELLKQKMYIAESRAELDQLQAQIHDFYDDDDDDEEEEDSMEKELLKTFISAFAPKTPTTNATSGADENHNLQPETDNSPAPLNSCITPAIQPMAEIKLSDENIQDMINSLPSHMKMAGKFLPDSTLQNILAKQGLDKATAKRAVSIFRGQK